MFYLRHKLSFPTATPQVLVEVFNSSTVPDRYTVNDLKTLLFNAYDSKAVTNPGVGPLRTQTVGRFLFFAFVCLFQE